jgi:hypothetical protein
MKGVDKKYQNEGWPFELGWIIIPTLNDEDSRKEFIDTCFRKKKVSIVTQGGGVAHNCPIPKHLLREIQFPENSNEVGSSVFIYIHPSYNVPIILSLFEKEDDADLSEEFEKRFQSINGENIAEINIRGQKGVIDLNVDSDEADGGVIQINVSNKSRDGKLKLKILGEADIYVSSKCAVYSNSEIDLRTEDLETEESSSINIKGSEIVLNNNLLDSFIADINAIAERYNLIESDINELKEVFNTWIPASGDGGAALKAAATNWIIDTLVQTDVDDIKDDKIKN